jgi:hypothetical protein
MLDAKGGTEAEIDRHGQYLHLRNGGAAHAKLGSGLFMVARNSSTATASTA